MKAYDINYLNCVYGSWFYYFLNNLKRLCCHGIDGIFLDGPVMTQNGCY